MSSNSRLWYYLQLQEEIIHLRVGTRADLKTYSYKLNFKLYMVELTQVVLSTIYLRSLKVLKTRIFTLLSNILTVSVC